MIDERVIAIVLAYNSGEDLGLCVGHLLGFFPAERILVVDNASTDDCTQGVPEDVYVERLEKNLGFCGGTNRLLRLARERGAAFALSINPDARVEEEDVRVLMHTARDRCVALAHPRVLREDDPATLDGAWMKLTWRHRAVQLVGEGMPDGVPYHRPRRVDGGHGACFLARVDPVLEVGGFNEDLFAYQDEVELTIRLRRKGYVAAYNPQAKALHRGPRLDAKKRENKAYYLARNSALMMRRYADPWQKVKFHVFLALARWFVDGPKAARGDAESQAALEGWEHGLSGLTGPRPGTWVVMS
ncbi:MAG: glycosyltransferase family 2 protein [Deltaproteobacteria bacterium]|nr:glycosyltransferase family 2 protein [Deltaproteobacteria bacterium]